MATPKVKIFIQVKYNIVHSCCRKMYKFKVDITGDFKLDIKAEYVYGLSDEWAEISHHRLQVYNSMGQQEPHGYDHMPKFIHGGSMPAAFILHVRSTVIRKSHNILKNMHVSLNHRKNYCQEGGLSSFILSGRRVLMLRKCCH